MYDPHFFLRKWKEIVTLEQLAKLEQKKFINMVAIAQKLPKNSFGGQMPIFWCTTPIFFQHSGRTPTYCSALQNLSQKDSLLLFLGPKNRFFESFWGQMPIFWCTTPIFFQHSRKVPSYSGALQNLSQKYSFLLFLGPKNQFLRVFGVKCPFFDVWHPLFSSIVERYPHTAVHSKIWA